MLDLQSSEWDQLCTPVKNILWVSVWEPLIHGTKGEIRQPTWKYVREAVYLTTGALDTESGIEEVIAELLVSEFK